MPEEIKYIDNNSQIPKLNENVVSNEIKIIENTVPEEKNKPTQKVVIPAWNIEPPVEIQRNIE